MADDLNLDMSGMSLGGLDLDLGGLDLSLSPDPNTISASINRGVDNAQRNFYSSAWEMGNVLDNDWLRNKGMEGQVINQDEMMANGEPMRFSDAEGAAETISVFVNTLAEAVPTIMGAGAAGVATSMVGMTPVPGLVGFMGAQNVGEVSNRRQQLDPNYEGMGVGEVATAGTMTLLDASVAGLMAKPFLKNMTKQIMKDLGEKKTVEALSAGFTKGGMAKEMAQGLATASVAEGMASAASVAVLEGGAHSLSGVEHDWDQTMEYMRDAAIMGSSLGGVMGGVGGYANFHTKARMIDPALQKNDPIFRVVDKGLDKAGSFIGESFVGRTWNTIAGDVVAPFRNKLSQVEKGKELIETFKGVNDLEQLHRDYNADHQKAYVDAIDVAKKHYGKKWVDELTADLKANKDTPGTAPMRAHLDDLFGKSVARKMVSEKSRLENYLPSNMDSKHILNNWDTFRKEVKDVYDDVNADRVAKGKEAIDIDDILAQYNEALKNNDWSMFQDPIRKLTAEELETATARRETEASLAEDALGRRKTAGIGSKMGNVEGHRVFDKMGQDFYNKWSKGGNEGKALLDSLEGYGKRLAHRFASVDKVGRKGEKLNRLINQVQQDLITQKGTKLTPSEINRIYQTHDAFQGTHGMIQDPFWRGVRNVVSVGTNWATLPLTAISSVVEALNLAAKTDMSTMVRATLRTSGMFGNHIMRKAAAMGPTNKYKTNATELHAAGQTWREATNVVAARLGDDVLSSGAQKWNTRLFKMNGLALWTQLVRNISAETLRLTLREDIDTYQRIPQLAEGQAALQRMTEVGLKADDIEFLSQPKNRDSDPARVEALMGRAINRFNRTVVLEPSWADRPLWMSDQKMWALSRLAGYPTMFTNTILPMLGKRLRTTPTEVLEGLFIIGAQAAMGVGQQTARDIVAGRDPGDREMNQMIMDSLMRNSGPRPVQILYDSVRSERYGRSAATTALGPVVGTSSEIAKQFYRMSDGQINPAEFLEEVMYRTTALGAFKKHWK